MKYPRLDSDVAINILLDWLDSNFEQFKPLPSEGLNSFTHIKPLGELALILFAFKAPSFHSKNKRLIQWIEGTSERLFPLVEDWGRTIDWQQLHLLVTQSPEKVTALLIFPVVSFLVAKDSCWLPNVHDVFRKTETAVDSLQIDLLFAKDLVINESCLDVSISLLLAESKKSPEIRFQTSSLYLVTHYIFFATLMGNRLIKLKKEQHQEVYSYLNEALEQVYVKKNYDLMAELQMCMCQLQFVDNMCRRKALDKLIEVIMQTGFLPGNHNGKVMNETDFHEHYHACLMGLSAIGHSNIKC